MKTINLVNKKVNMLTVIKKLPSKKRRVFWLCKCECGNEVGVMSQYLINNQKYSCGCCRKPTTSKYSKYGTYNKRLYAIWNAMKARCYNNKNNNYKYYGARGIKVCDEWLNKEDGFINFQKWALSNGYKEGLTIDRIDVNGNYEPNNCRWIPTAQNNLNRRGIILINYNEKKICLKEYCKIKNISYYTAKRKYKKGIKVWEE